MILRLTAWLLIALCGQAAVAQGLETIEIADPAAPDASLDGMIWTPCATTPNDADGIELRGVRFVGVVGCPVQAGDLPLIVISHGAYGWLGAHRGTAAALANAGFVVAAVTHPDRKGDRESAARTAAVRRLLDFMLADWRGRDALDRSRIGFFGYSRGTSTGLRLVGGKPNFRLPAEFCRANKREPFCMPDPAPGGTAAVARDDRIKAAVLAAPVGVPFSGGLKDVTVHTQIWRAANDRVLRRPHHAEVLRAELPVAPDYHVVKGAGHFSFLTPCPPRAPSPMCRDAPGFDRLRFQKRFHQAVAAFFRDHL